MNNKKNIKVINTSMDIESIDKIKQKIFQDDTKEKIYKKTLKTIL